MIGNGDQSEEWLRMESTKDSEQTNLEILSNFTNKSLEGELANEQLSRLLVTTNFTESDSSRPETMGLLHSTSGGLQDKLRIEVTSKIE